MPPDNKALAEGILFTDQYQLTMAQVYFRMGLHETTAQFDHYFRSYPDYGLHQAGYCINAGMQTLLDWMRQAHFGKLELDYLRGQTNRAGQPVFGADFLQWLGAHGSFDGLSLFAIPEGRMVHPTEPLTVVQGPLAMAQILETALLNMLNFQTLIATKASRIHISGRGRPLLEFGMRRGHDRGVNAGARAALIGGADFTSNVGLSATLGLPPKGTHAHSLVQAFMALGQGELGAFRAYADVFPDDCLLLVDTISTLESGVPNAIRVFEELRRKGHTPAGIRLDSGDLAYLSIQSARLLNQAGFPDTSIVLSNNLDELVIWQIITQIVEEAPRYGVDADQVIGRLVYGVGTGLITSRGDSALDGVYKLVGLQQGQSWTPAIKVSETPEKTINPGDKRVWRLYDQRGRATGDLIGLTGQDPDPADTLVLRHPLDASQQRQIGPGDLQRIEPLLAPVLRDGQLAGEPPSLDQMRAARETDLAALDAGIKRLVNPHVYHVSLSEPLWDLKQGLIAGARGDRRAVGEGGRPA